MLDFKEEIQSFFEGIEHPPEVVFLFAKDETEDFQCLYGHMEKFQTTKHYTYYDIFPLIRILCSQKGLFSEQLLKESYETEKETLCFLLEWNEFSRKVMLLDLSQTSEEENKKIGNLLRENKKELNQIFQKIYYKTREES